MRKDDQIKRLQAKIKDLKNLEKREIDVTSISPAEYDGLPYEELKNKLVYQITLNLKLEKELAYKERFEAKRSKALTELEQAKEEPKVEIKNL